MPWYAALVPLRYKQSSRWASGNALYGWYVSLPRQTKLSDIQLGHKDHKQELYVLLKRHALM